MKNRMIYTKTKSVVLMNLKINKYYLSFYKNKTLIFVRYLYVSDAKEICRKYITIRLNNTRYTFDKNEILIINQAFDLLKPTYNNKAYYLNPSDTPTNKFENKESDKFMILLWNIIFPNDTINSIDQIKTQASVIISRLDTKYPTGVNMNEKELIRYITAHSASSFLGIQNKSKSKFALESLDKTILLHASYRYVYKPWLIKNLDFLKTYVSTKDIMNKHYGELCLSAKTSRTSIVDEDRDFRDFVFQNTLKDVIKRLYSPQFPPYLITAAQRDSRRGKPRLICSFNADVRIIDFIINNGSYDLCSKDGILSEYTTEGMSGYELWKQFIMMSARDPNRTMICLDFKGYDTQISLQEYLDISRFLNQYRLLNTDFKIMFDWFENWLTQPKMLISQGINNKEVLIPNYRTLASGLHGTHSFENLIGISYAKELQNIGIPVYMFKANGDDQNILTHSSKVDELMNFTSKYFEVEYSKSLIGHQLTVWGKKWFTRAVYPVVEIGTIRSIWEREAGDINIIESSKFENNYCKILTLIIFLYRLGITKVVIISLITYLCNQVGIDQNSIPLSLSNLQQIKSRRHDTNVIPVGLESSRNYLKSKTLDMNLVGSDNIYDMLLKMYDDRIFFTNEVKEIKYHSKNSSFIIESNLDYSVKDEKLPWMFRGIDISLLDTQQLFVRSVLQGTNSYDGPYYKEYRFHDMYSLAIAIHNRNNDVWLYMQQTFSR